MVVLFLLLAFLSCSDTPDDLKRLQVKYGDFIFAALYSLPESKNQFLEITGNESWETYAPKELAELIPEEAKQKLIHSISGKVSNKSFTKRVEYWILAYYQLYQAQLLTSTEETMAAIYQQEQTRGLFHNILANRNMKSDVDPLVVGSTVSSGEANEILYSTLNVISNLEAKDRLIYFNNLHATLSDLKN